MNNINNVLVSKKDLEDFINKYTRIVDENCIVKINNIDLMRKTLIHKSLNNNTDCDDETDNYCAIDFSRKLKGDNERLEFLGDRVLDLVVAEYLFDLYPEQQEGFLSDTKSKIVKKDSLKTLCISIGLPRYMLVSTMMERAGERATNANLPENIFESFIGGLFKDQNSNFYICRAFIIGVLRTFIDLNTLIHTETNFKTLVNKEFNKHRWGSNPIYIETKSDGDVKGKKFNTTLCVPKENITDPKTIFKFTANDKVQRKLIDSYEGNQVNETYYVLSTNVEPFPTKKKAEQRCSEIFMETMC